jgi:hypothetical protein
MTGNVKAVPDNPLKYQVGMDCLFIETLFVDIIYQHCMQVEGENKTKLFFWIHLTLLNHGQHLSIIPSWFIQPTYPDSCK